MKGAIVMIKIDVIKVVKIVGTVLSIGGSLASKWAGGKENHKILEKLANDHFNK